MSHPLAILNITDASYVASGRGYTATGLIKPDFVAPGVDVYGVRAGGGYTTRTGTSVAAAHAAGAAALLLTWGVTNGNLPFACTYNTDTQIAAFGGR